MTLLSSTEPPFVDVAAMVMEKMVGGLVVHPERLEEGCVPALYATDAVFDKVAEGETFRDAYKEVGLHLETVVEPKDKIALLKKRTSQGTTGNLGLDADQDRAALMEKEVEEKMETIASAYARLSGLDGVETTLS